MPQIACLNQAKHIRVFQPIVTYMYVCTLTHCTMCVLTVGILSVHDQILLVVNSYIVDNDHYHDSIYSMYVHTHTHIHAHAHTNTHTCMNTQTHVCIHAHARTHAHTQHTHTRAHTQTHTHTNTYIHIHTILTYSQPLQAMLAALKNLHSSAFPVIEHVCIYVNTIYYCTHCL